MGANTAPPSLAPRGCPLVCPRCRISNIQLFGSGGGDRGGAVTTRVSEPFGQKSQGRGRVSIPYNYKRLKLTLHSLCLDQSLTRLTRSVLSVCRVAAAAAADMFDIPSPSSFFSSSFVVYFVAVSGPFSASVLRAVLRPLFLRGVMMGAVSEPIGTWPPKISSFHWLERLVTLRKSVAAKNYCEKALLQQNFPIQGRGHTHTVPPLWSLGTFLDF